MDASGPATRVESFVAKQLELLQQEKNEEFQQNRVLQERLAPKLLQKQGVCLLALRMSERRTGLYGRLVVTFESAKPFLKELPSHRISPGDVVGVYPSQKSWTLPSLTSGIVTRCTQTSVSIAIDTTEDKDNLWGDDDQFLLLKLANDVTYKRLKDALNKLRAYTSGSASNLIAILFGEHLPSPALQLQSTGVHFFNAALDDSQREAVLFALNQKEIAIVHGPPGTGKTTTVIEIVMQAVHRGLKVLACAPSNIAVDGLVERLAAASHLRTVRLGHPARALPAVQRHTLDAVLSASDGARIVDDVRREIDATLGKLKKMRDAGERRQIQNSLRSLRKELRERSDKAVKDILGSAQVILATLTSATDSGPLKILDDQHFDLTIIDECSQATEAACWVALLKCGRCILAGDHKQLPPTIVSQQAAKAGLARTLMERLLDTARTQEAKIVRMLTVQYRMHELIMQWSSEAFYEGRLVAHASVARHLLRDLPGVQDDENTCLPLLLIDTTGCGLFEVDLPEEISKANEGEADLVALHAEQLIKAGVKSEDIAVISPYNLQVELLRSRLSNKYQHLEVKSVDGFQGREKEAVIISCVRSNKKGEVGFLAEDRRLNVAVTRARRHVAVVCDAQTIGHHRFLLQLVEYFEKHGEVRSAHTYTEQGYCLGENSSQPVLDLKKDLEDSAEVAEKAKALPMAAERKATALTKARRVKNSEHLGATMTAMTTKAVEALDSTCAPAESPAACTDDDRRLILEGIITDFVKDRALVEHVFSNKLNSFERRIVHEIAEQLGLDHLSMGEGKERQIVLKKVKDDGSQEHDLCSSTHQQAGDLASKSSHTTGAGYLGSTANPVNKLASNSNAEAGTDVSQVKTLHIAVSYTTNSSKHVPVFNNASSEADIKLTSSNDSHSTESCATKTCSNCSASVPTGNYELHMLTCGTRRPASVQALDRDRAAKAIGQAKSKSKRKEQMSNGFLRPLPSTAVGGNDDDDDFEKLMREAAFLNSSCSFGPSCKTPVTIMGQMCELCARRFCFSHHMPEVHGCGSAAKARARQLVSREGATYIRGGSGLPNKKPSAQQRAALEQKLAKKLDKMTEQRKPKVPGSGTTS